MRLPTQQLELIRLVLGIEDEALPDEIHALIQERLTPVRGGRYRSSAPGRRSRPPLPGRQLERYR